MGILSWILFGLIAGALAKWIMPGDDPGGIIITIIIGIVGAFVGGYIGTLLGIGEVGGFNAAQACLSPCSARWVLLAGYRLIKRKA